MVLPPVELVALALEVVDLVDLVTHVELQVLEANPQNLNLA